MRVFSAIWSYFYGNQQDVSIEKNQTIVDCHAQKVLDILKKVPSFNTFMDEKGLLKKADIISLDSTECKAQDIFKSQLKHQEGTLIYKEKNQILFDRSLPIELQVEGVLIEFCNLSYIKEIDHAIANASSTTRKQFVHDVEYVEFKAIRDYIQIANEIEKMGLFAPKSLVTDLLKEESMNFDLFLRNRERTGHAHKYEQLWATLN